MQPAVIVEHAVDGFRELLVCGVNLRLCARHHHLIDVLIAVLRRIIRHALHQPLALPIAVCRANIILRHVQLPRHLLQIADGLMMIARHQAEEVHAHRVPRRFGQIIKDELVGQRRYVKQRRLLVKGKHRHASRPPYHLPTGFPPIIPCLLQAVKCGIMEFVHADFCIKRHGYTSSGGFSPMGRTVVIAENRAWGAILPACLAARAAGAAA